jgi:transcriptional regulator with XRE-family HTH domain
LSYFSERLLFLRHENSLSQKACAQKLQISPRAYAYYEAGEREPNLSVLIRMADFYGVTLDYLAGRTDTP